MLPTLSYILLALVLWPFNCSVAGGLRFYTGLSPELSLIISTIVSCYAGFKLHKQIRLQSYGQIALCIFLCAAFQYRLYNLQLGLLVNYGCADAANHLSLYRNFITDSPDSYNGFNSLYICWFVLEKLFSIDTVSALYIALLFPLFTVSYILAYYFKSKNLLNILIYTATALIISELVVLPLFHYNQADGYLAHLFSISVILPAIIWGSRLPLWFLASALLCSRFSYGLQLPDLLATSGIYLAICGLRQSTQRFSFFIGSLISIAACTLAIIKLTDVFTASGSIIAQNLDYAFAAQIAGIAALLQVYVYDQQKDSKINGTYSFPLFFLVASSALQVMWLLTTQDADYYFSKLFLYSSLVLAIFVTSLTTTLLEKKTVYLASSWLLMITFLIVAQRPYLPSYYERVQTSGEYKLISPLIDTKVREIINEVLEKEQKSFAAYYTSRWGQFSFFNGLYHRPFSFEAFNNPPDQIPEGSCIFWSKNSNDVPRLERYQAFNTINWLNIMNAKAEVSEVKYNSVWAGRQVIRYFCRN